MDRVRVTGYDLAIVGRRVDRFLCDRMLEDLTELERAEDRWTRHTGHFGLLDRTDLVCTVRVPWSAAFFMRGWRMAPPGTHTRVRLTWRGPLVTAQFVQSGRWVLAALRRQHGNALEVGGERVQSA